MPYVPISKGYRMRKQLGPNLYQGQHGGRRPGAGRRRMHSQGVAHVRREKVTLKTALHINFKVRFSIRNKSCLRHLKRAIQNARAHGLKILHFSLQSNHVHLLVEASDNEILTRGMRSLTVTFARRIGRGRIQLERYHLHVLRTLRETRHAAYYVLFNQQKHCGLKTARIDVYSSLGTVRDLKKLAVDAGMSIRQAKLLPEIQVDAPSGWMIGQVLG
jgi:REP element-mobilizing transposase RayT